MKNEINMIEILRNVYNIYLFEPVSCSEFERKCWCCGREMRKFENKYKRGTL